MTLLILGLALWVLAHLFKRIAPGARASLQERTGNASKGIVAVVLLAALVLIVIGYRGAEFVPLWQPPAFMVHINNLLMLIAVGLFATSHSKSRLRGRMRHPQLSAVLVWAVAHLLVNGDAASVVLFGTMLGWAVLEIALINRQVTDYTPYAQGSRSGDIRLVVITLVVFVVIALIHGWIGPWPFPG